MKCWQPGLREASTGGYPQFRAGDRNGASPEGPRAGVYQEAVSPTLGSGCPAFSLSPPVSAFRPLLPNFPLAPAQFPDNITNSHL